MISPELLRRYGCFSPIKEETLKAVAMRADETTIPANTRLFQRGDPADTLSIIVRGEVDIQYTLDTGELRTVDTLVDGDILGWSAVVEPYRMTGTATTRKETRLIRVQSKELRELCARDTQLGARLMSEIVTLLSERLERARVQMLMA
jgi:CRP-like cAMP-binding protein